ncbi:DUF7507 domain-containing protein [Herbidospora cretacea]|uniref:DUF7507 domain-containing protein n=1 Tax=Herbidospora cretacea TaxID=28444 RepID=UPI0007744447|nr:DUF11 domain-containing protein [Herbidospora cretacea]
MAFFLAGTTGSTVALADPGEKNPSGVRSQVSRAVVTAKPAKAVKTAKKVKPVTLNRYQQAVANRLRKETQVFKVRKQLQPASLLLNETFTGATIADSGFVPLGTVCLTGATVVPPPGVSATGPCNQPTQTTPPVPAPGVIPGYLQLTDNANYRVGGVVYNRALSNNNGLVVEFDQFQYGGNGADGIGFFLVDGAAELKDDGADGGSLGYAQRNLTPGVDSGYLGVGLDAYGNFVNDGENRGNQCPANKKSPIATTIQVPDTVTVRGPGQGLIDYCWIATTMTPDATKPAGFVTTLPGSLRDPGAGPGPALRRVRITLSSAELLHVDIDFNDGNGYQRVLDKQLDEPAPPTVKFGFSASTGGLIDTHLIRNLVVGSVTPLQLLDLVTTVQKQDQRPPSDPHVVGDVVHYDFLVTNTGPSPLTGVSVSDPTATNIVCPTTTLGPAGTASASMTCTGEHTITVADATGKDTFTTTATANATSIGGPISSNPSSATVPVKQLTSMLDIAETVTPDPAKVGQKVTYTITATNTGGVALNPATLSDDLSKVLDKATYNNDLTATVGTASITGTTLTWFGNLPVNAQTKITFSVTTHLDSGGQTLTDVITSSTAGADCVVTPSAEFSVQRRAGRQAPLPCGKSVPITPDPQSLTLTTTVTNPRPPTNPFKAGDEVDYSFTVTHGGVGTVTGVKINDPDVTNVVCPSTTLGPEGTPSATMTCTGSHVIQPNETLTGTFTTKATATGTYNGATETSNQTTTSVPVVVEKPQMTIAETVSAKTIDVGGTVTYTITVTNTGKLAIAPASITDNLSNVLNNASYNNDLTATHGTAAINGNTLTWSTSNLAPGESEQITFSVTADQSAGGTSLTDSITSPVTGATCATGPTTALPCTSTVAVAAAPQKLILTAAVSNPRLPDNPFKVGDTVNYTFTVTHQGIGSVTGVQIFDQNVSPITCPRTELGPQGTPTATMTCTASHVITAEDARDGTFTTLAQAQGNDGGAPIASNQTETSVRTVVVRPILHIAESVSTTSTHPGGVVTYTIHVTNAGLLDIPGAQLVDNLSNVFNHANYNNDLAFSSGVAGISGTNLTWVDSLVPGETETITFSVTARQDAGGDTMQDHVSSATPGATCTTPCGPVVTINADPQELQLTTTVLNPRTPDNPFQVGDTVQYRFTLTHQGIGNVTGIVVDDPTVSNIVCPSTTLGPQGTPSATMVCTASHVITGEEAKTGTFTTYAQASGTDTDGPLASNQSQATVPVKILLPNVSVAQTATPNPVRAGQIVTITETITNLSGYALSPLQIHTALVDVLNNGTLVPGSIASSTGAATITGTTLNWEGSLANNANVVITFQIRANSNAAGRNLVDEVSTTVADTICLPGSTAAPCTVTVGVSRAFPPRPPHHHCKWGWDKKKKHCWWPRPHKPVKPFPIDPVDHEEEAEEEREDEDDDLDEGRHHHKPRHHHHHKWHHGHHHHHKWHHGHRHHHKWHHRHHHRGWGEWGWKHHHKPHKFVKVAKKVKVKARKTWACRTMTAEATCAPLGDGTSQYVPGLGTLAVARLAL